VERLLSTLVRMPLGITCIEPILTINLDSTTEYSTIPSTSGTSHTGKLADTTRVRCQFANNLQGPYTIGSGLGPNTTSGTTTGLTSPDAVTPNTASVTSSSGKFTPTSPSPYLTHSNSHSGPAVDPTSSNTTSNSGPHSSNIANKADPRVDSDNDRHTGVGSSNIGGASTSTNSGPHDSNLANKADPRVDSDNDRHTSSGTGSIGGIGSSSWMSTALPHREGNNTTSSTETSSKPSAAALTGTTTQHTSRSQPEQSSAPTGLEDITSQPPNNLPQNVPTGTSTDFVAPGSSTSAVPSSTTYSASNPKPLNEAIPSETAGSSVPAPFSPEHSALGSRGSIAVSKPDNGVNPTAIPTAGGKKVGEDAYVERKSMQADSIDSGLPTGATTSANTARNVGTAEATGIPSTTTSTLGHEHEKSSVPITSTLGHEHEKSSIPSTSTLGHEHEKEKSSVVSGSSEPEHKEKKSLKEKIKEKVHIHKH
jgi:hypothetical protein